MLEPALLVRRAGVGRDRPPESIRSPALDGDSDAAPAVITANQKPFACPPALVTDHHVFAFQDLIHLARRQSVCRILLAVDLIVVEASDSFPNYAVL